MTTIFHLNGNEIDADFAAALRQLFRDKQLTLTIDADINETEYLLRSKANKKILLSSLKQAENSKILITSLKDLK